MEVQRVKTVNPAFGYSSILKKEWKLESFVNFCGYNSKLKKLYRQGKLPKDLVDMGGNKLNQQNLSLDHIVPRSKNGPNTEDNLVLATKQFNSMRGDRPISEVVTKENLIRWVNQYLALPDIEGFNFKDYVLGVLSKFV